MSRLSSRDSTLHSSEADRREAAALYPPSRVNHLGVRKSDHGQRHKFVKTMTISFDKKDLGLQKVDKHWQLIEDAARQSDFSIPRLKEMLEAFNLQKKAGSTLVGPHTFRRVLAEFGIKDAILVRRLFEGFCGCGTKVDYRDLLRSFCSVSDADIEEKLMLLVPLYDGNGQGIDLAELTQLVVKSVQAQTGAVGATRLEQERREAGLLSSPPVDLAALLGESTVAALEMMWHEIREVQEELYLQTLRKQQNLATLASPLAPKEEEELRKAQGTWTPPGAKPLGMSAEVMIRACRHRPSVRLLLETFLNANTIRATDGTVDPSLDKTKVVRDLHHRLTECDMEVFRKVTLGSEKPSQRHSHSQSRSQLPLVKRVSEAGSSRSPVRSPEGNPSSTSPSSSRLLPEPIWEQRGASSVTQTWSTTALIRRKYGQSSCTVNKAKHQFSTDVNRMMPLRNSLSFANLVEPKVLQKFLNKSRSDAGLPPLNTNVEKLLPSITRRGASSASLTSLHALLERR